MPLRLSLWFIPLSVLSLLLLSIAGSCSPAPSESAISETTVESSASDIAIDLAEAARIALFATEGEVSTPGSADMVVQQAHEAIAKRENFKLGTLSKVGENCDSMRLTCWFMGGFQTFEPLESDASMASCEQVRADLQVANRLWSEFETVANELMSLSASIQSEAEVSAEQLLLISSKVRQMTDLAGKIASTYPKDYGQVDRFIVYAWTFKGIATMLESTPPLSIHQIPLRLSLARIESVLPQSITMPGFSSEFGQGVRLEEVYGLDGGFIVEPGLLIKLRKKASPIEACIDGWRVKVQARVKLAGKLTTPTLPPPQNVSFVTRDISVVMSGEREIGPNSFTRRCDMGGCISLYDTRPSDPL